MTAFDKKMDKKKWNKPSVKISIFLLNPKLKNKQKTLI
jgi:hypothetical protein